MKHLFISLTFLVGSLNHPAEACDLNVSPVESEKLTSERNEVIHINSAIGKLARAARRDSRVIESNSEKLSGLIRQRHSLILDILAGSENENLNNLTLPQNVVEEVQKLVPNSTPYLEKNIDQITGKLTVLSRPKGRKGSDYLLSASDGKARMLHLRNITLESNLRTDSIILVKNLAAFSNPGDIQHLLTEQANVQVIQAAPQPAADLSRSLFIAANFQDNPSQPYSINQIRDMVFNSARSTRNFYQLNSFGRTNVGGDVAGWLTLPVNSSNSCDFGNWGQLASTAAQNAGFDLTQYDHLIYIFPTYNQSTNQPVSSCTWTGLGSIGGQPSLAWIFIEPNLPVDYYTDVITHEIGHGAGLHHANFYECGNQPIDVPSNCFSQEYGDPFDVMGAPTFRFFNAPHQIALGWVDPVEVETVSADGIYQIIPLHTNTHQSTKILKIHKPNTGDDYYLSYRLPEAPFDNDYNFPGFGTNIGTHIHIWDGVTSSHTQLVAASPNQSFVIQDSAQFYDPINSILVMQEGHDSNGATISVRFNTAPCVLGTPSVGLSANTQQGFPGQPQTFTLNVTNTDSNVCPPRVFGVNVNPPQNFDSSLSSSVLSLGPGQSGSVNLMLQPHPLVSAENYPFSLDVSDPAHSSHQSASGLYAVLLDQTPPTGSITSPVGRSVLHGKQVTVGVAVQDNNQVLSVDLFQDNRKVASSSTPPFTMTFLNKKFGRHKLRIRVTDYSGNVSKSKPENIRFRKK